MMMSTLVCMIQFFINYIIFLFVILIYFEFEPLMVCAISPKTNVIPRVDFIRSRCKNANRCKFAPGNAKNAIWAYHYFKNGKPIGKHFCIKCLYNHVIPLLQ